MSSIAIRGKNKGADGLATTTTAKSDEGLDVSISGKKVVQTLVEEASATVTYIGKAERDTATSVASWLVSKVDTTTGVVVKFASNNYDQIWDNRASLTYK